MKLLKTMAAVLLRFEHGILVACELCIALLICGSVLLRYVLNLDFAGLQESVLMFSMWLYFIGSAVATCEDGHINADVLTDLIKSGRKRAVLSIVRRFISILVYGYIAKLALEAAWWIYSTGPVTSIYRIPVIVSWIPVAACFVLSVFYTVHHLYRDIRLLGSASPRFEGREERP